MAQFNLGRILPVFKGTYSNVFTYYPLDIVYYNGSSYVCKQQANNITPTNTTYWLIVAMKGELSPTLSPEQEASIIQQIENDSNFVIDANYVHTDNNFTNAYKSAIDNIGGNIGDGTITIQRNGTTIGTFKTNDSGNTTVNVQVPTLISDLTGDSQFIVAPMVERHAADEIIDIATIKANMVYWYDVPVKLMNIQATEFVQAPDYFVKQQPSYLIFTVGSSQNLEIQGFPNATVKYMNKDFNGVFEAGKRYQVVFYGETIDVTELQNINIHS